MEMQTEHALPRPQKPEKRTKKTTPKLKKTSPEQPGLNSLLELEVWPDDLLRSCPTSIIDSQGN